MLKFILLYTGQSGTDTLRIQEKETAGEQNEGTSVPKKPPTGRPPPPKIERKEAAVEPIEGKFSNVLPSYIFHFKLFDC